MIGIVDYGAGNLLSVKKALKHLNADCKTLHSEDDFEGVKKIILPGVGAFQSAIENLKAKGLYEIIGNWLITGKSYLGICLGMQILFEGSEESNGVCGYGVFPGKVLRFTQLKVPQIGWNQVNIKRTSKLMKYIENNSYFYFLHSFYAPLNNNKATVSVTEYGLPYVSALEKGNICAVQFHPEKSGKVGLKLLNNWMTSC